MALMPLLPVALESAAETTYPVPEEASGGILILSGQVFGIIATGILNVLIPKAPTYETVWTPAAIFCFFVTLLLAGLLLFWNAPSRRQAAESDPELNGVSRQHGSNGSFPSSLSLQMLANSSMERGNSVDCDGVD